MRRTTLITLAVLFAIALVPVMSLAVVRTDSEQDAALDRIECTLYQEHCPEPTATPSAEPTATMDHGGTVTLGWHAPGSHDGLNRHEHGDAPPSFATTFSITNFGHPIVYGGDETSGPAENAMKHQAFKGIIIPLQAGGQAYLRYHAASNPMDRSAQFHSYEVYLRDTAGNVSFFQGLYDTGSPEPYPAGDRVPRTQGDPGQRPIMLVVDQATWDAGIRCEQWYMFGNGGWSPEFALTICNSTTLYVAGENATAHDQSTWIPAPDGSLGLTRRSEVFWYPSRVQGFTGWFCAEPDGDSPTQGSMTCPAGSLPQYIAPTLAADARVNFGVNRIQGLVQKQFSCPSCVLPN